MSSVLKDLEIILGVSGGIAAYKAVDLASRITQAGASVHTVMTRAATEFVAPLSFQSVTGNPVAVDMFEPPRRWSVEHIALADRADIMVIAPATANFLGKMAGGIADDYLSTVFLAVDCPVLACPAMNHRMWDHPAVRSNVSLLKSRGVQVLDPEEGRLASGARGRGRLPSPETIFAQVEQLASRSGSLEGFSFLVTAGPTREFFDPVRFISNPSTGKMGYGLARELVRRGGRVTLVAGPTHLDPPPGARTVPVVTAEDMRERVMELAPDQDCVIMAAAVCDVRPVSRADGKVKKGDLALSADLERTTDILKELGQSKGDRVLVGFALESGPGVDEARRKLREKNLDMIVLNWVDRPGSGFASDTNLSMIIGPGEAQEQLPEMEKTALAARLADSIGSLLASRSEGDG